MDGYAALKEGAAWLDLSERGKIRVTGEDRARLLHAMTTNHIQQLRPGSGCYAYFLSAQGRILADVNVFCLEEELLLDTEPETRARVYDHLDKFIIADDVTLEDATDSLATIAVEGPRAAVIVQGPEKEYTHAAWEGARVARVSYTGGPGFFLFVEAAAKPALVARLEAGGAVAGSAEAFEITRIENVKPRYGVDLSERFLAQEANQPQALSFEKGCYLGQEIVERVRSRGQVHRLLMGLAIEGDQVPAAGTKILEGAAGIAEITSAAYSPGLGKVVAMAYVRADRARPGTQLHFEERLVTVRGR